MTTDRVNWLNAGLMIVACAAALTAPFRLFLIAYAVLGPLHYLTEISWLHDRNYFTKQRTLRLGWLALVLSAMIAVVIGYVGSELLHHEIDPAIEMSLVILVFVAAAVAVFSTYRLSALALTALGGIGIAALAQNSRFAICAYLLVTMVHVLVFTGCFILFGAAKSKSASGIASFAVFLGCIATTLLVSVPHAAAQSVPSAYAAFEQLNRVLLMITGHKGAPLDGDTGRHVMQLIAFAYTYHYLNWFSKTTIIGWHEMSKRRALLIGGLWIGSMALYAVDYRAGFSVLYVLSILHVLLEFPLNHFTIVGLVRSVFPQRRAAIAR